MTDRPKIPSQVRNKLIFHASLRGLVSTPAGVGVLTACRKDTNYVTVIIAGRHHHPHIGDVTRLACHLCGEPADPMSRELDGFLCRTHYNWRTQ